MNPVRESVDRSPLPTVRAWVAMLTISGLWSPGASSVPES